MSTKFVTVTRDEFFAKIGPLDVHPRPFPECSLWETPSREVLGRTVPGYANTWSPAGKTPSTYQLAVKEA